MNAPRPIPLEKIIERLERLENKLNAEGLYVDANTAGLAVDELKGKQIVSERLRAVVDWADLALAHPEEFNSHGVKNLDGPVFDQARQVLAA